MFMRLEEVRNFWTKVLGIHGPQWMSVMALQRLDQEELDQGELDQGEGATVQAIADLLQVNLTPQSSLLENKGFIRRKASARTPGP